MRDPKISDKAIQDFSQRMHPINVLTHHPLHSYTTYRLGGPADIFVVANTTEILIKSIKTAKELNIPVYILGGGSNVLISDTGYRGLVVKNELSGIRIAGIKGSNLGKPLQERGATVKTVFLTVESGVGLNRLVRYTLDQGLKGLETFLGQPGSVGGAVYMNAHSQNAHTFIGDYVLQSLLLNQKGELRIVDAKWFQFNYDFSRVQKTDDLIVSVTFRLEEDNASNLWKIAQQAFEYRSNTQPTGVRCAGCVFKNISKADAMRLATPNYTKSAGYLIEHAGLKEKSVGGASVSSKHANFITLKADATASDVIQLIKLIVSTVKKRYLITLHPEIVLVGDFPNG